MFKATKVNNYKAKSVLNLIKPSTIAHPSLKATMKLGPHFYFILIFPMAPWPQEKPSSMGSNKQYKVIFIFKLNSERMSQGRSKNREGEMNLDIKTQGVAFPKS